MESENVEIKYMADAYDVCEICLSSRQLSSLEYSLFSLFNMLCTYGHIRIKESKQMTFMCWECVSLLKHANKFIRRAQISQGILEKTHSQFNSGIQLSHLKRTSVTYVNVDELTSGCQSQNQLLIYSNYDFVARSNDQYSDLAEEIFDAKDILKTDIIITTNCMDDSESLKYDDFEVETKEEIKLEIIENNLDNFDDQNSVSNESSGKGTHHYVDKKRRNRYECSRKYETIPGMENAHKKMVKKVLMNEEQGLSFISRLRDRMILKRKWKYMCMACVKSFKNESLYKKHQSSHHGKRAGKLECAMCSCRLPNRKKLHLHLKRHYYRFECVLCGIDAEFRARHLAESHVLQEHCRQFRCTHCQQVFKGCQELSKHFVDMHSRYQCFYCSKIFKTRSNIIEHIKNSKSLPCPVEGCGKKFCTQRSFESHKMSEHAPESHRYCVECDKLFDTRAQYKTHIYSHNVRNCQHKYVCKVCGKVSKTKALRDSHYNYVHLKKTDFYCKEHDKYFYTNNGLTNHMKSIHLRVKHVKNKLCQTCGRYFSTNRVLMHHIRTHTGERPYVCGVCSAAFAQKSAAFAHAKRAHPNSPKDSIITFQESNFTA